MTPTLHIDQSEFQRTLIEYMGRTKRTIAEVINRKAFDIVLAAFQATPRADRGAVMAAIGASLVSERVNRKGKTVRRYAYGPDRNLINLVQANRASRGQPPLTQAEALAKGKGRLRAVGSLAAGWLIPMRKLAASFGLRSTETGPRVKQKGGATPAKSGWDPVAEWTYTLTENKPSGQQIDPRVVTALQAGFDFATKDMQVYLARKMQEDADRHNAK